MSFYTFRPLGAWTEGDTTPSTPGAVAVPGEANATAPRLIITATGEPAPQGSKLRTAFGLVDDNAKTLKPWRDAVTKAAELAMFNRQVDAGAPWRTIDGPVFIEATISLRRPGYHYRTGKFGHLLRDDAPGWPIARGVGDTDKYLRAICDALTIAKVWTDDVLVVEAVARKVFCGSGGDALDCPGAVIRVMAMTP